MKIILITGKAGSGKNEASKYLNEKIPHSIVTGVSKYIKILAKETTDWDGKEDTKPRTVLQTIGDNLRAIDKNFLTKRLLEDIEFYKLNYDTIIVSDVRLKSEIEYFKQSNYDVITIRINCNNCKRNLTAKEKEHHTETELDNYNDFDYIIENNYDENFYKELDKIIEGMK